MSQKNSEHIIDYILRKTEKKPLKERWRYNKYVKVEYAIDKTVYFCNDCGHVWSFVPHYVDFRKMLKYPKGNIPTIGKKRKKCTWCANTK
jgi:hypothetical protein